MKLNEKIYFCRRRAGLSQDALAEKIGVSRQAVSKWETGTAQPELDKLAALARTFDVTADWLLSEEEPEKEEPPEESEPETQEPAPAYPAWLDDLPGFLSRTLKRYGWIYGVYLSAVGALFTGMGALGRFLAKKLFSSDPFGFSEASGSWIDVEGIGKVYLEPGLSPLDGAASGFAENNPVSVLCGGIMGIGVILILAGVVLAVLLKRYRDRE
ncbi:MAG: helix-turn-helix domain-containing protein [Eubacteriales bacterium]